MFCIYIYIQVVPCSYNIYTQFVLLVCGIYNYASGDRAREARMQAEKRRRPLREREKHLELIAINFAITL